MTPPPLSFKQVSSVVESASAKIALWVGAVSAGKTIASLFAFLFAVRATRGTGLVIIVGKTLQTIERNILAPLMDDRLFGELSKQIIHTKGSGTAWILGREVHLVGANDSRSEEKIRGSTVELAYVDEATLLPPGFWEMLISRLRVAGARCLATTNPGSTRHWLRLDWILQAAAKNMVVFHFTMDDNPQYFEGGDPGPAYIADMKASYTGVFYDRMIRGLWTNAEGAVYDMWDPTRHVIPWDRLPPIKRVLCASIDYGTQHATSVMLLGLGYDRRLYMMDELRIDVAVNSLRKSPSQQSKTVRDWLKQPHHPEQTALTPEWVVVDTAAADFRQELYVDGLATQGARKDVTYGIGIVSSLLQRGQLVFTDRCTGWTNEVTDYVWDPKATERGVDEPVKRADDSMDAGRYAVVTTESLWRGELAA
ncbi:PBSX family phage terminase large subunit [Pseudarthrobacter sp. NIBRBAC000502771]|uniref:PBSX family phage terminase large subunit n=1 Tax=Pseudarthrobacter sp. NIBRBAC000502771 TaxID=2590774 RepID=UPI00112FF72F|nr:terminase family protein [Pseudarthrobacter sp. NIBRBAC000502771]QDG61229.1 PBSX family phage terminase large subunit [Pseudarthrobacter sp. NIBRBAC000502771]